MLLLISGVHLPNHDAPVLGGPAAWIRAHQGAEENTRRSVNTGCLCTGSPQTQKGKSLENYIFF